MEKKKFYLTPPFALHLAANLHIGNTYDVVLADMIAGISA